MAQTSGGNSGPFEEDIKVGRFDAQDPPHLVGGDLPFVDQAIERPLGDPEPLGGLGRAQPFGVSDHIDRLALVVASDYLSLSLDSWYRTTLAC